MRSKIRPDAQKSRANTTARKPGGALPPGHSLEKALRDDRPLGLFSAAQVFHLIMAYAMDGDEQCGRFLAEIMPAFSRRREQLENANPAFRRICSRIEATRITRKNSSPLRGFIHEAIDKARDHRRVLAIIPPLQRDQVGIEDWENLRKLPELEDSKESAEAWTTVVVYPYLKKMGRRLSDHPGIDKIARAKVDGKFQLSRLRRLIVETVQRIARLPRTYYTRLS